MGMNGMGALQTIQKILLYTQIVDGYVKLALNICLLVGVIVLIRYFLQKTAIEKAEHKCKMNDKLVKNIVDDMSPKTVEEAMENMDI